MGASPDPIERRRPGVSAAQVRDAALDLFARQGYHGTAVSEIARSAVVDQLRAAAEV